MDDAAPEWPRGKRAAAGPPPSHAASDPKKTNLNRPPGALRALSRQIRNTSTVYSRARGTAHSQARHSAEYSRRAAWPFSSPAASQASPSQKVDRRNFPTSPALLNHRPAADLVVARGSRIGRRLRKSSAAPPRFAIQRFLQPGLNGDLLFTGMNDKGQPRGTEFDDFLLQP